MSEEFMAKKVTVSQLAEMAAEKSLHKIKEMQERILDLELALAHRDGFNHIAASEALVSVRSRAEGFVDNIESAKDRIEEIEDEK